MSKITRRETTPGDGRTVEHRLARLLDTPSLARVVPHLPPEALHQLIQHRGLADSGDIVASATPAQLTSLIDLDLWRRAQPGRDHLFDADRFGEWLEVLVDAGSAAAARTVAALDENLVVAGLSRYVRVFDPGIFEPTAQSDDEPGDRHEAMREGDAMPSDARAMHESTGAWLECEVGGYLVRARRADAWDAIVTLLIALDAEHASVFHAVMQGCRRLSNSSSEIDGLDDLLPVPEQHLHDLALERERRQSQQGYATPADARAFLELARRPLHTRPGASAIGGNPIATAYFRAADDDRDISNGTARSPEHALDTPPSPRPSASMRSSSSAPDSTQAGGNLSDIPESLDAIIDLLAEAGLMPQRPRALLEAADADPKAARLTRLRRLMTEVHDTDETAYFTRTRELAFLANALLAGCSVQSRPFTPQEASDAAAGICNLGLEHWPARWPDTAAAPDTIPPDSLLLDHGLVTAFEVGWSVLHQDVSLFAAEGLISTLARVDSVDPDTRRGLAALRRTLVEQRDAGTPWRAREAAEILALLDMTAWISMLGLLDECPVLPAALTAVLEGRTTVVSQTEFDFISTTAQIDDVRAFMRKLPDLLSC